MRDIPGKAAKTVNGWFGCALSRRAPGDEEGATGTFETKTTKVKEVVKGANTAVHDSILRHLKAEAVSAQMLGVPAVRSVFSNIKLRVVDEEYMPLWLLRTIDSIMDGQAESLIRSMLKKTKKTFEEEEEMRLSRQARPKTQLRHPYLAIRASVLHALMPADETLWYNLNSSLTPCFFLLCLIPYAGIQIWTFVVLFIFIDRRDEYQLVQYIAAFKTQLFFFNGILRIQGFFVSTFDCLLDVEQTNAAEIGCAEMHVLPDTNEEYLRWAATAARVLVVYYAFVSLICCSRGGAEQIDALEKVRLDAADGTIGDGYSETEVKKMDKRSLDDRLNDLWDNPHLVYGEYERLYAKGRAEALQAGEEHKGRGGPVMLMLLAWDVCVFLAMMVLCYWMIHKNNLTASDWLTWYALEYTTIVLAIASFPYVFFMVMPKEALTGSHRTGYDVRGWLCRKLTMPEIRDARAHHKAEATFSTGSTTLKKMKAPIPFQRKSKTTTREEPAVLV